GCDVPRCAGIGKRLVAVPEFDRSGQCPRTGDLNLERPAVSLRSLLDGVEILGQPTARPVDIATRPVGEPPPARDGLGRQVEAERGGAGGPRPPPGLDPPADGAAPAPHRTPFPPPPSGRPRGASRSRWRFLQPRAAVRR